MKRGLLIAFFCAGCGHSALPPPTTTPPTTNRAEPSGLASLTTTVRIDRIEWRLLAGGAAVCADEAHCADAGESVQWQLALSDAAYAALPTGMVIHRALLATYSSTSEIDVAPPHADGTHLTPLGRQSLAITHEPLEVVEDLIVETELAQIDGRPSRDVILEIATEIRAALGAPDGYIFVGAARPADGVVPLSAELTVDELRAQLVGAWIGEDGWRAGLARYLAWQIDGATQAQLLARFMVAYRAYRELVGQSPNDDPQRADPGGVIAAFCADVELHSQGSSLAAELHRAHDLSTLSEETAVSLANRVAFSNVIDVAPCLVPLGQELVAVRYESPSAAALLRVGLDEELRVSTGRGFFQTGDKIVTVAGSDIENESDIAWALHATDVGERFVVVVEREGATRRTWARRPRVQDAPRALRFDVRRSGRGATSLD